jgi:shikimate dehydrogenase
MPRLAVLGQPISHSRSPAMHTAALEEMGLAGEWTYEAIEVSPDSFAEFVRHLPGEGFAGVNVTVPHKLAALELSTSASEAARKTGAANTLTFRDGQIDAENTDTTGIIESLPRSPAGMTALVLGAGGSARAAIWALKEAGAEVNVWNRTAAKARALADEFGIGMETEGAQLLVNATTVGMDTTNPGQPLREGGGSNLKNLPILTDGHMAEVVVDLAYGSSETDLIAAARAAGAATVDGLEVLVRQGAASLRLWTGVDPPIDTMRAAARGLR